MDPLIHAMIGLHIIGIAALLGGFLTQMKAMGKGEARMVPSMLHGALTMLVTGMALVGLHRAQGDAVNTFKIGLKLSLLVVVLALVYLNRDQEEGGTGRNRRLRHGRGADHGRRLHRRPLDVTRATARLPGPRETGRDGLSVGPPRLG